MIDLHTHTTFSDGTLTPAQLVAAAATMGLSAVAVTDHDTVDGLPEALAAGERLGFTVVPGVEINLEHERVTMDMLGYFLCGPPSAALEEQLAELRRYRDERNASIIKRLAGLGLPLDPDDLAEAAGDGAVGRPHIGLALMRRGYVDSVAEAFHLYLRRGAPAWVDRRRLSLHAAVRLLGDCDGLAVLAHPGLIRVDLGGAGSLAGLVREAAAAGIAGLECYHPSHDKETIATCLMLAARHDLVVTGGSDFHGAIKPDVHLGVGPGGMAFPDEMLAALTARAGPCGAPR
jgi:hypothetical protein